MVKRITNTVISKSTYMSFPLVGNPSDLFGIVKKDAGQAGMTEIGF
jgi:hypothetical protein